MAAVLHDKILNSTDATRGQPLAARVLARKDELEVALADLGPHESPLVRQAIERYKIDPSKPSPVRS